ncbi:MAG: hypothetical protein ABSC06_05650 [Rhodopila sp.]|jgi:hypothetical protein
MSAAIETWDTVYRFSYCILIGSLFAGVVTTTLTFAASNRISADLTSRLGIATKTAGEANERAAVLEADAAKSRERTAALEVEAGRLAIALEAAQAETQKIEQAAAWRIISPDSKARLTSSLANGLGGSVELSYSANDPESLFLASQIEGIFKFANTQVGRALWHVVVQPRMYSKAIFWDVRIFGQNDDVTSYRLPICRVDLDGTERLAAGHRRGGAKQHGATLD